MGPQEIRALDPGQNVTNPSAIHMPTSEKEVVHQVSLEGPRWYKYKLA